MLLHDLSSFLLSHVSSLTLIILSIMLLPPMFPWLLPQSLQNDFLSDTKWYPNSSATNHLTHNLSNLSILSMVGAVRSMLKMEHVCLSLTLAILLFINLIMLFVSYIWIHCLMFLPLQENYLVLVNLLKIMVFILNFIPLFAIWRTNSLIRFFFKGRSMKGYIGSIYLNRSTMVWRLNFLKLSQLKFLFL